jgi:hypothetical protein
MARTHAGPLSQRRITRTLQANPSIPSRNNGARTAIVLDIGQSITIRGTVSGALTCCYYADAPGSTLAPRRADFQTDTYLRQRTTSQRTRSLRAGGSELIPAGAKGVNSTYITFCALSVELELPHAAAPAMSWA